MEGAVRVLSLIGRILYGWFFFYNGLNHFMSHGALTQYATGKGVPAAGLAVYISGLLILIGGALLILGYKVRIGALLIIVFLLPVSFIMHNYWAVTDPAMKMADMVNFWKNMALMGAALMLLLPRTWPLALEKGETVS